jgi:hypothetical protein
MNKEEEEEEGRRCCLLQGTVSGGNNVFGSGIRVLATLSIILAPYSFFEFYSDIY